LVNPPADPTTEPESPHVSRSDQDDWFGHPRQLARLFTVEMWERFGYYGMRALLALYLANHFLFDDNTTNAVYGAFTSLAYLTPLVGGWIADRYLGSKRSVKLGALLMAIGYFTLCFGGQPARPFAVIDGQRYEVHVEGEGQARKQYVVDGARQLRIVGRDDGSVALVGQSREVVKVVAKGEFRPSGHRSPFYSWLMIFALSILVVGNGFFKPNISTIVGSLYPAGDRRRDAGFTIFYMGINLGSLFSQILCPWLADSVGWWAGFLLAAVGMLLSWMLVQFDGGRLAGYGDPPPGMRNQTPVILLGALLAVPVVVWLFHNVIGNAAAAAAAPGFIGYLETLPFLGKALVVTFLLAVVGIPLWSWRVGTRAEAQMMSAAVVLVVFNVAFWTLFEQAGSSLTLFAERNTDLSIFGWFTLTAGQTQFFNAFFIIFLAPLMSILWTAMARRGIEPPLAIKFGVALIGVGAGFFVLVWGARSAGPNFQVSVWWLVLLYLIHSIAELCISPVGLSMITKLAIARVVGLMMGVWFLSISVAQYVAGSVAQLASVQTVGGQVTNFKVSLGIYLAVFSNIGIAAIAIGCVLLLLSPLIKRWTHGVT
jgi:POT family proton-dependent oligopeptide transporter